MDIIEFTVDAFIAIILFTIVARICYKDPKVLIMIIFVAIILVGLLIAPTVAEEVEEVRTAFVHPFDYHNFEEGTFTLRDEDGFLWDFYLNNDSYVVGDEYTLHLPFDGEPWYE